MGAVHGVYLKYVGMSTLSYAASYAMNYGGDVPTMDIMSSTFAVGERRMILPLLQIGAAGILKYSAIINGTIAVLFKVERGMGLIGKDPIEGRIPLWSYLVFFPFHLPTLLYTYVHTKMGTHKVKDTTGKIISVKVPVASEVQPGWWVGGCYSNELNKDWGGVIDLTVEFPESCINRTQDYLLVTSWDGVPPEPIRLEKAANFAVEARKKGDVLIHCAHGRGRSTTVMCAALVKAGLFPTWQEAFEKGIKPHRSVCKLNRRMRNNLTEWQMQYVDKKKTI